MMDLELDAETHDIIIENYGVVLVDDPEQIKQNVKQRLLHFTQEWFLNLAAGTPWIESILIKGASRFEVEAILKQRISGTRGIVKLLEFSMDFFSDRGLQVDFTAQTWYGSTITDQIQVVV